jgi:hypothetical protein
MISGSELDFVLVTELVARVLGPENPTADVSREKTACFGGASYAMANASLDHKFFFGSLYGMAVWV